MHVASVLHDVLEDTPVTPSAIERRFGAKVLEMVLGLTEPETEGNRATRKALERDRLAQQGWEVQTIKVADLISNTRSIQRYDPKFAKVYLAEKRALLPVLDKASLDLLSMAQEQIG